MRADFPTGASTDVPASHQTRKVTLLVGNLTFAVALPHLPCRRLLSFWKGKCAYLGWHPQAFEESVSQKLFENFATTNGAPVRHSLQLGKPKVFRMTIATAPAQRAEKRKPASSAHNT